MMSYILGAQFACFALAAWAVCSESSHRQDALSRARGVGARDRLAAGASRFGPRASTAAASCCTLGGRRRRKSCCSLKALKPLKPLPPAPAAVAEPVKATAPGVGAARGRRGAAAKVEKKVDSCRTADRGTAQRSGPDSADRIATASSAMSASTPTGRHRRRCRCGGGRSVRAGRRSRCAAICSTRRNSAATRRSSRAIACRPASRCGVTPIRCASMNRTAARARAARRRFDKDRVYSMGATGILNALDANTGNKIWSHDTSNDTTREVPYWGISSSPLVVDDVVIVSVGGTLVGIRRLDRQAALDRARCTAAATARRISSRSTASRRW